MNWEIASPVIIVLWATGVVLLERLFPYDKGQRLFRQGFFTDFFWYTLVHSYWLGLVISALIRLLDRTTGLSRLHLVSDWPLWVQVLFFFVTHDFYIYWFHRAQHNSRFLWRLHEAHHSVKDVDWVAGSRSHALEIVINQTIEYAPIVLLGAAPEVALIKGVIDATWGMYIHSNINVRTGALQRFLNGPEMHRWHHSSHLTEGGINYATKLAVWDYLFGTAYLPNDKPKAYGLSGGVWFPDRPGLRGALFDYFWQHVYAFRPFEKGHTPKLHEAPAE